MKTEMYRALMLIVCAFVAVSEVTAAGNPPGVAATAAQIARAQASKPFIDAIQILTEQDEEVNLKTVRNVAAAGKPVTLQFDITRRGSKEPGEFKRLVYIDRGDKPAVVRFDEKTGRAAAMRITGVTLCFPATAWRARGAMCIGGTCFDGTCDRNNLETRTCGKGSMTHHEMRTSSVTRCGCTPAQCLHVAL
jgi:hypothetical protein